MALPGTPRNTGVGGALFSGGGKGSMQQSHGSPHAGSMAVHTPGDPLSRSMGQYKKGHSFTDPSASAQALIAQPKPAMPIGKEIRGGAGTIRPGAKFGGIGPGPMASVGGDDNYSMKSADTE